jgi:hypothetical protein
MLGLSGCGNAIPEMSDEQMTMVTEYAAGLLLKYDANYQPMLLNQERLEEEEEIQKEIEEEAARMEALEAAKEAAKNESAQDDGTDGTDSAQKEELAAVTPAEFLELDQVSISYNGIEYVDTYPESGDDLFFALNASEGCKLAIIHLQLENVGTAESDVDIFDTNAKFKVSINGGEYHSTMMTLLDNDFTMYTGTLAPGEKVDTVLILELQEEACQEPETLNLYIKYNDSSIKTSLY